MCGFAGVLSAQPKALAERPLLAAIACLKHRGPEPARLWTNADERCAMAHGRLSIIDPDERSRQPFAYNDRFTVVYNGELYNYVELRTDLRSAGFSFRTESDTEVVAAAWAAWGPACLEKFDGAFAFAIWDAQEGRLFAARDRFGEKPFFFYFNNDMLLFASELKALWEMGAPRRPNAAMAFNFLTIGYTGNPADASETFFEDLQQLPAGHWLSIKPGDDSLELTQFGFIGIEEQACNDEEAIERFRYLFATSVRRRLRSDVAVGTSLSGGLDSSAVLALCRQEASAQYTHKAFTAVFPGFEKDERRLSELVAKQLGAEQHFVEIDDAAIPALMDRVMWQQEQPIGSGSALAQFRVFEAAKAAGVTVLLDGQGADEVLAGYDKYFGWHWRALYRQRRLGKELSASRALGINTSFGFGQKLAALAPEFGASLLEGRYARKAAHHPALNREWARAASPYFYYMLPSTLTLNGVLHYNTFTNGLEELLRLADRNSMAHSLEVRLPFLSAELVQFLFTLPAHFKIREGRTKWLLRQSMKDLLPDEVLWQVRKTGFEPPQARWMALPAVEEAIRAAKEKLVGAGVLSPHVLQQRIKPHSAYAASAMDWKFWSLSYLY